MFNAIRIVYISFNFSTNIKNTKNLVVSSTSCLQRGLNRIWKGVGIRGSLSDLSVPRPGSVTGSFMFI